MSNFGDECPRIPAPVSEAGWTSLPVVSDSFECSLMISEKVYGLFCSAGLFAQVQSFCRVENDFDLKKKSLQKLLQ